MPASAAAARRTDAGPALALAGATGTGKTAISIALARLLGAEIVGCDSRQLYRELEIGTGKPTPAERTQAPHHLFDALSVAERASAGRFERLAAPILADITGRGRVPLVVGGSGFYLEALRFGLPAIPPVPEAVREQVVAEVASQGVEAAHAELAARDPAAAARIAPRDRQRVARALEVWRATSVPFSEWRRRTPEVPCRDLLVVVLEREREPLARDLDRRTRAFFAAGLVDEVRGLLDFGVPPGAHGLATLAYREAVLVARGELSLDAAIETAARATRLYAKRQRTWWRGRGAAGGVERVAVEGIAPEDAARRVADLWTRHSTRLP